MSDFEQQLDEIVGDAVDGGLSWTGPTENSAVALRTLLAREQQCAGFIVELPGGTVISVMFRDARSVALEIGDQSEANAVLFSLIANKFIRPESIPPGVTPDTSGWGDVTCVEWFRWTAPDTLLHDRLYPNQLS